MEYANEIIRSADGTEIVYRQSGSGPGVILVHGGMMASQSFTKLGECLAPDFTIYIPDRRGRGQSGTRGSKYGLIPEAQDIQALALKTGAHYVFGLSSGAIVSLQAAILEPSITKLAIYEPPIPFTSEPLKWAPQYEKDISRKNYGAAMASIIKGTGDRDIMSLVPKFILSTLFNLALKDDEKNPKPGDVPLKQLIKAMDRDIYLVRESADILRQTKNLAAELLLLCGDKSANYLIQNIDVLQKALPQAKRFQFKAAGHTLASNGDKPERVAVELRKFFN